MPLPPMIAKLLSFGGNTALPAVSIEQTLEKIDLSGDRRFPTVLDGAVNKTNPYRPPQQHAFPSVPVRRHPGIPPSSRPMQIGPTTRTTGVMTGQTRPRAGVPESKTPRGQTRATPFDLGQWLNTVIPSRTQGSGIGRAMDTGPNEVKRILSR